MHQMVAVDSRIGGSDLPGAVHCLTKTLASSLWPPVTDQEKVEELRAFAFLVLSVRCCLLTSAAVRERALEKNLLDLTINLNTMWDNYIATSHEEDDCSRINASR